MSKTKERMTVVRISPELHAKVKKLVLANGMKLQAWVAMAVREKLERDEAKS